MSHEVAKVIY